MGCWGLEIKLLATMKNNEKAILKIVIKGEWFDQIVAKTKKIEYRRVTTFWTCRLYDKNGRKRNYDRIEFINGYNTDARRLLTKFEGVEKKGGIYNIHIGRIIK